MSVADIAQAAGLRTPIRHQLFIGGRFVDAESARRWPTLNPHDNSTIAEVAMAGGADVDVRSTPPSARCRRGGEWPRPIAAASC